LKYILVIFLLIFSSSVLATDVFTPVNPEFIPGTYGFADTKGPWEGNGEPTIYVVDELGWNTNALQVVTNYEGSGITVYKGSIKKALLDTQYTNYDQGRIILFEVSGTINEGGSYQYEYVAEAWSGTRYPSDFIWIAGQSAPPPGITLYNIKLMFTGDHSIIQHIRMRVDDDLSMGCDQASKQKCLMFIQYSGMDRPNHNIIDHCSFSYGIDSLVYIGDHSTMTNNILAYPLRESLHPKSFDWSTTSDTDYSCHAQYIGNEHSKGISYAETEYGAFIDNVVAFSVDRDPLIRATPHIIIANNLIHYGTMNIAYDQRTNNQQTYATIVGNVAQKSDANPEDIFMSVKGDEAREVGSEVYLNDNLVDVGLQDDPLVWDYMNIRLYLYDGQYYPSSDEAKVNQPVDEISGLVIKDSSQVKQHLIDNAGAFPNYRDEVDEHVIEMGRRTYISKTAQ